MYYFFSVLILIAAILLILIVLVQNSKGGGLASNFAGSNQVMGVRQTTDFLEKATWVLAIAVLVLSVAATTVSISSSEVQQKLMIEDQIQNAASQQVLPSPTTQPQAVEPVAQPATQGAE